MRFDTLNRHECDRWTDGQTDRLTVPLLTLARSITTHAYRVQLRQLLCKQWTQRKILKGDWWGVEN